MGRKSSSNYMQDYCYYRKRFTPEQRARYDRLLGGRSSRTAQAECVDIILRDLDLKVMAKIGGK